MGEVTLAESIQTLLVVVFLAIALSVAAGALSYVILKPIVGWVLEPLEREAEE